MLTSLVSGGGEYGPAGHVPHRDRVDDLLGSLSLVRSLGVGPSRTAWLAASAGALLVGSALNRVGGAEFGGAAVLVAPFLDVVGALEDSDEALSGTDVVEFGDVHDPAQRARLEALSPIESLPASTAGFPCTGLEAEDRRAELMASFFPFFFFLPNSAASPVERV